MMARLNVIPESIGSHLASLYVARKSRQREKRADALLVSFAKSGRTWLRVMIGKAIVEHYGLDGDVLGLDSIRKRGRSLPVIVETHDGGTVKARAEDVTHGRDRYRNKSVLFMVRDPRDVVVSAYFQASKRKRVFEGELSEYLRSPVGSLDTIIAFCNAWARERDVPRAFHMVRYEDLHREPSNQLREALTFLGLEDIGQSTVEKAVAYATFENMRRLEMAGETGGGRLVLRPKDKRDVESYKTRRGKAGGYRDYLDAKDIEYLNQRIVAELDPFYGY